MSRVGTFTKGAVATAVAFGAATGIAAAVIPGSNGVIDACYATSTGTLRVIDASQPCRSSERRLTWNEQGQRGPQGPEGPEGPPGALAPGGVTYVRSVAPAPATASGSSCQAGSPPVEVATTSGPVALEPGLYLPIFTGLQRVSATDGSAAVEVRIERVLAGSPTLLSLGQSIVSSGGVVGAPTEDNLATLGVFHVAASGDVQIRYIARANHCASADIRGTIELLRVGS